MQNKYLKKLKIELDVKIEIKKREGRFAEVETLKIERKKLKKLEK